MSAAQDDGPQKENKMSRPQLPPNQSASAVVKLRVHPRQKSAWVRAAQRNSLSLSAWLSKVADIAADGVKPN